MFLTGLTRESSTAVAGGGFAVHMMRFCPSLAEYSQYSRMSGLDAWTNNVSVSKSCVSFNRDRTERNCWRHWARKFSCGDSLITQTSCPSLVSTLNYFPPASVLSLHGCPTVISWCMRVRACWIYVPNFSMWAGRWAVAELPQLLKTNVLPDYTNRWRSLVFAQPWPSCCSWWYQRSQCGPACISLLLSIIAF